MIKLNCPNCGKKISAENINIQKMVAVCADCNTVFPFNVDNQTKQKRALRKVKRPKHLHVNDYEDLELSFRTNFRLDQAEDFIQPAILSVVFTFVTSLMYGGYFEPTSDMPIIFPLAFTGVVLMMYYLLALRVYNKTHIHMDDYKITVSRRPLRGFRQPQDIMLANVVAIRCEETPKSIKEAYDTPRFSVWAQLEDGRRRVIVTDVTEEYGFFIAQVLQERLFELRDTSGYMFATPYDAQTDDVHLRDLVDDVPDDEPYDADLHDIEAYIEEANKRQQS